VPRESAGIVRPNLYIPWQEMFQPYSLHDVYNAKMKKNSQIYVTEVGQMSAVRTKKNGDNGLPRRAKKEFLHFNQRNFHGYGSPSQ